MAQAGVGGIYRCGGAARKDGATSLLMASHGDHTEVVKELKAELQRLRDHYRDDGTVENFGQPQRTRPGKRKEKKKSEQ